MRGLFTLFFVFVFSLGSVSFSQSSKNLDSSFQSATDLKSDKGIMVSSPRGHYLVIAVQEQISIYQVSYREGGVMEV